MTLLIFEHVYVPFKYPLLITVTVYIRTSLAPVLSVGIRWGGPNSWGLSCRKLPAVWLHHFRVSSEMMRLERSSSVGKNVGTVEDVSEVIFDYMSFRIFYYFRYYMQSVHICDHLFIWCPFHIAKIVLGCYWVVPIAEELQLGHTFAVVRTWQTWGNRKGPRQIVVKWHPNASSEGISTVGFSR